MGDICFKQGGYKYILKKNIWVNLIFKTFDVNYA